MFKQQNINDILKQIAHLDEQAQHQVVQKATELVNRKKKKNIPITSLNGLGANIWKKKDIDAYIKQMRNW